MPVFYIIYFNIAVVFGFYVVKIPCFLSFFIYFFHYFFINYLSSLQLQTALINTYIPRYLHIYSPCIYTFFYLYICVQYNTITFKDTLFFITDSLLFYMHGLFIRLFYYRYVFPPSIFVVFF